MAADEARSRLEKDGPNAIAAHEASRWAKLAGCFWGPIPWEHLSVDQAALTGESLPVTKRVGDSAYSGSIARQGSMTAMVTATGNGTFFGRTAKLVAAAGTRPHAERAVLRIGDFLILPAAALGLRLMGVQLYRDAVVADAWSWATMGAIAQLVLVPLIAAVPVAMPAVMSVTMALGALALSKQKAIVSRLSAIDELAGVDVVPAAALASQRSGDDPMPRPAQECGRGTRAAVNLCYRITISETSFAVLRFNTARFRKGVRHYRDRAW